MFARFIYRAFVNCLSVNRFLYHFIQGDISKKVHSHLSKPLPKISFRKHVFLVYRTGWVQRSGHLSEMNLYSSLCYDQTTMKSDIFLRFPLGLGSVKPVFNVHCCLYLPLWKHFHAAVFQCILLVWFVSLLLFFFCLLGIGGVWKCVVFISPFDVELYVLNCLDFKYAMRMDILLAYRMIAVKTLIIIMIINSFLTSWVLATKALVLPLRRCVLLLIIIFVVEKWSEYISLQTNDSIVNLLRILTEKLGF